MTPRKLIIALLLSFAVAAHAQSVPRLYRSPTMNADRIVFAFADAMWSVSRSGGVATKLNATGTITGALGFSPNGWMLAYSANVDGNTDVYVADRNLANPRRLTWHPGADQFAGWSPDGKNVLFSSAREQGTRATRVFTTPADGSGGPPKPLPMPYAAQSSYSPDGRRVAYTLYTPPDWKMYRGGRTPVITLINLTTLDVVNVPRPAARSNDFNPMWVGSRVYFLSDRDGPTTLYSYDVGSGALRKLVENADFDLKSASAGPGGIIYEKFGGIHIFDLASERSRRISIDVPSNLLPGIASSTIQVPATGNRVLSPSANRVVLAVRGEIFVAPADSGRAPRNLTRTPSVVERQPTWSADGRSLYFIREVDGKTEWQVQPADGSQPSRTVTIAGDRTPGALYPSPDGSLIAYTDRGGIWVVASAGENPVRVASGALADNAWSPDGKWVAYTSGRRIGVASADGRTSSFVTDASAQVSNPTFDATGQYVYFLASLNRAGQTLFGGMDYGRVSTSGVYVVPLAANAGLPTGSGAPSPTRVDTAGLATRVVMLPIPMANFTALDVDRSGALYVSEGPAADNSGLSGGGDGGNVRTLWRFTWSDRQARPVFTGAVSNAEFSDDRSALAYSFGNNTRILPAAQVASGTPVNPASGAAVAIRGLSVTTDPIAEWRTMYHQAWQHERQNFYDPTLHGLNVAKAESVYAQFLPGLGARSDLTYLLREMLSNVAVSHLRVSEPGGPGGGAGANDGMRRPTTGLLGADLVADGGRYRIARIYRGDQWTATESSPLDAPAIGIKEGDYILAVNGKPLRVPENYYRAFEGTAGRRTTLSIASSANGAASRDVTVTPMSSDMDVRNFEWIQDNVRTVDRLSNGRVAYIYMPNTSRAGQASFIRYYLQQSGKEGLVIDERFNGGGDIADWVMTVLRRRTLIGPGPMVGQATDSMARARALLAEGPKVMITNEWAGSGGDIMPFIFRQAGLGTLVGTRTNGGTIGGAMSGTLLDGGTVSAPRSPVSGFGEWGMENVGVAPDIEVLMDAKSVAAGSDPQLEAAVTHVLSELNRRPRVVYRRAPPLRPRRGNGLDAPPEAPRDAGGEAITQEGRRGGERSGGTPRPLLMKRGH